MGVNRAGSIPLDVSSGGAVGQTSSNLTGPEKGRVFGQALVQTLEGVGAAAAQALGSPVLSAAIIGAGNATQAAIGGSGGVGAFGQAGGGGMPFGFGSGSSNLSLGGSDPLAGMGGTPGPYQGVTGGGSGGGGGGDFSKDIQIQMQMQMMMEQVQMQSNILKVRHEAAQAVISNIH